MTCFVVPAPNRLRGMMACLVLIALVLLRAPFAMAHPLGDFSINQYFILDASGPAPAFHYLLDVAEIPSFTELDLLDTDFNSEISQDEVETYLNQRIPQLAEHLHLRMNGAEVPLAVTRHKLLLLEGNGGMVVFNILLGLEADGVPWPDGGPVDLAISSDNYPDEQGSRECAVLLGGRFTDATGDLAPEVTGDQQRVDQDALDAPVYGNRLASFALQLSPPPTDARGPSLEDAMRFNWTSTARLAAEAGESTLGQGITSALIDSGFRDHARPKPAPLVQIAGDVSENAVESGSRQAPDTLANRLLSEMSAIVRAKELPPAVSALGLLLALCLGMGHALSPGHGKTVMAAYLVGEQGTSWHAVILGIVVTITHTWSVILLGIVTLYVENWFSEEQVNFWTGILSGLIIIAIGITLFRRRYHLLLASGSDIAQTWRFDHGHDHAPEERPLAVGRDGQSPTYGSILWLGISGGVVPCPAALIVLLLAIKVGRLAYGLSLIVAFSVGLALVLVIIGLLVVRASRLIQRSTVSNRVTVQLLPLVSAGLITLLGGWVVLWTLLQFNVLRFV